MNIQDTGLTQDQTFEVRKHIFEVRNQLKSGWSEHIYHHALELQLRNANIPVRSKVRQPLIHRGIEIHTFEPDLILWDKLILELKMLPHQTEFIGEHFAQIIHYLKFNRINLGFLVNFAPKRVKTKRVIWHEPALSVTENLQYIEPALTAEDRAVFRCIREGLIAVAKQHGLGYSSTLYRDILAIELKHLHLSCHYDIDVPAKWHNRTLAYHRISHLHVADKWLVNVCALPNYPPEYEFTSTKTYLTNLGLRYGIVVNFGHKNMQIFGVLAD